MAMTGGVAKLVHTGIPNYGATTNYPVKLYVYYKSTQSQDKNQSTLQIGMYLVVPSGYNIGPWGDYGGSYVGTESNTFDGSIPNTTGTRWLVENKSFTVNHDVDGKATATIKWKWGVNSPWGQFESESGSFKVTLPTIARASTVGATDANIGSKSSIVVNRKGSSYTHSIGFKCGAKTGYITESGGVSSTEVKLSALSISWTVPTSFYEEIPNAKTGTCTLTIKTYSGNTQIGSAQTDTLTVTAAKSLCAPSVSGVVLDSNEATKALTGDNTRLVRYKSTAHCTITATAKNSATITQKKIGGVVMNDGVRSISGIDADSIDFYALDSRGYDATAKVQLELIPYVILTNNTSGRRTDPTSGNATISVKGDYFNGTFGSTANALTIQYRYRQSGGTYGAYSEVTPTISGNTYTASVSIAGLDYENAYEFQVVVADKLDTVTKEVAIKQGIPVFDWGQKDFKINVLLKLADYISVERHACLGASTYEREIGVNTMWADNTLHWLIYRLNTGLTCGLGWPGSSGYTTTTVIRGNTVQCQNASGTTTLSDERMKKDFADLSGWEDFFGALEPCAFRLKDGSSGRFHLGFRAQQVEAALESAGMTSRDFAGLIRMPYQPADDDPDGTAAHAAAGIQPGDDLYGLIYPEFVALNTYIIQQLQREIAEIRAELNELKQKYGFK